MHTLVSHDFAEHARCICGDAVNNGHVQDDAVTFPDGCGFTNRYCPVADVWLRCYLDEDDNPHGHELPARWPQRIISS